MIGDPALKCPTESPRFCFNATGLETGSQYKVQVATRIEGGSFGPWSKHVIANTLKVLPDAPGSIHLIEKTDHSLHIRWTPPNDPKGEITQYRLSIVSLDDANDRKRTYTVDHPTLTYLFDDLNPETRYNISIAAGTKRGFGNEIWTAYSTDPFNIPVLIRAPQVGLHIFCNYLLKVAIGIRKNSRLQINFFLNFPQEMFILLSKNYSRIRTF